MTDLLQQPVKNAIALPHWDETAKQYTQLIGYWMTRSGSRSRRRFYFGADEKNAKKQSIEVQKRWERLVADHALHERAKRMLNHGHIKTLPVWPTNHAAPVREEPTAAKPSTIAEAKTAYLASKEAEVALVGGVGIKPTTYNGLVVQLNLALAAIDTSMPLSQIGKAQLEAVRNWWMRCPGKISTRTAINYCKVFKGFMNWCDEHELLELPRGADKMFTFDMPSSHVEAFDAEKVKAIFKAAPEKTLLYCLVALNVGAYQADLGNLRHSELKIIDGEPYFERARTKMTTVDGTGAQNVLTWLWPETYALILSHMAPETQPYLLLNSHGDTLYGEELGAAKRDAITPAYQRACTSAGVQLQFRQFRKFGWNAMKNIGGEDLARKWAGQNVKGISRCYNRDEYGDVTKALKSWRSELVTTNVLSNAH